MITESGEQLGIMPLREALNMAREQNSDLVEVAPTASPPVCRLMDYGRFRYEQTKKEREARKSQKHSVLREIRLRPKIDQHDMDFKTRAVEKLLTEGDKVKISVVFRGREVTHPQLGRDILQKVIGAVKDVAAMEKPPSMEGRAMTVILAPISSRQAKSTKAAKESPIAQAQNA